MEQQLQTPEIVNGVKRKPAPNPTNWKFRKSQAAKKIILPKKASLKDGFSPVIYNQIYNNCTSNAALAVDDYYYHGTGKWVPSTTFTYYWQKVLNEEDPMEDDGSCVETALDAIRKYGACNSTVWPNDKPFDQRPNKKAIENGLKGHEVTKYYVIKNLTQVKKALSQGYPIVGAFTWVSGAMDENYVLYEPTKKEIDKCNDGHALAVVGYDDTTKLIEFRNSWGEDWGNGGYAYMTYSSFKKLIWWEDSYAVIK